MTNIEMNCLEEAIEMFHDPKTTDEELDKFLNEVCSDQVRESFLIITANRLIAQ